jgi:hypothetical protein
MARRKKKPASPAPVVEITDTTMPEFEAEGIGDMLIEQPEIAVLAVEDVSSDEPEAVQANDYVEESEQQREIGTPLPLVPEIESRVDERASANIHAVIQGKDGDESWKELVEIATVSKQGAGFTISRECSVGRLLVMVIKMPYEYRLYDHFDDVYPMLAVVQHCYAATRAGLPVFNIGVAFIGKSIPETYKANPGQCYRITGMNKDGLWEIVEAANTFRTRRHSRFSRRLEVVVSVRDNEKRESVKHRVFTKDISAGGMSVWGPLAAKVGDRVKISSEAHNFYSIALVRNRVDNTEDETKSLVHFEFEGADFPVQQLHPNTIQTQAPEVETSHDNATKEAAFVIDKY